MMARAKKKKNMSDHRDSEKVSGSLRLEGSIRMVVDMAEGMFIAVK